MENGTDTAPVPTLGDVETAAKEVATLQEQIQQLLNLQKEAESENHKLAETLSQEQKQTNGTAEENLTSKVQRLEQELQIRTEDRENYKNKLQLAEKRITELEAELDAAKKGSEALTDNERATIKETLDNMTDTLKSSTIQTESFQRQNTQLQSQVKALKEVVAVHKELLNIRGLETDQLKTTIKLLEDHALAEKERRSAVLSKMETAVKLNAELKNEYENQLRIFQDLKSKYEQKVELIKIENEKLRALVPPEAIAVLEMLPEEPLLEQ
ncbi:nuclear mitotic apparatus protein 1-like [Neocloeon triangulifer]|uniref:nuclear mitotic apparatus protein 1-like n=1 Tax=Neocloeon triangulifer TaxID=2078957 RepID=UPI00286EFAF4|nr:nuclear mitotic apparatus protein 1-like [Neocloeon triangulifer]